MKSILSKLKRKQQEKPAGQLAHRAYIIGDVHGCYDLLRRLLNKIDEHEAKQDKKDVSIIFLGDLIDRGPDSYKVIDFLLSYTPDYAETVFLMGNHEEVFLSILSGNADTISSWFGFGGRACARSYQVTNLGQVNIDPRPLLIKLQHKVPKEHIEFISGFKDYHVFGDYLCVHAGIKPKTPLDKQRPKDLRWIRSSFLNYNKQHSHTIVHGHTVVEEPTHYGNRIAIDTGAGKGGGVLTALCIDGTSTHFLTVRE